MHSSRQGIIVENCKTRASQINLDIFMPMQTYSGMFGHIQTYLDKFSHNQTYSGIIHAYADIFRTPCNPSIFKTIIFS